MVQPGQVPVCRRADNQLYECNANHRNPNSADLIFATVDGAEYFDLTQLFSPPNDELGIFCMLSIHVNHYTMDTNEMLIKYILRSVQPGQILKCILTDQSLHFKFHQMSLQISQTKTHRSF